MQSQSLSRLVQLIYNVHDDPYGWHQFLGAFSEATRGAFATIYFENTESPSSVFACSVAMQEEGGPPCPLNCFSPVNSWLAASSKPSDEKKIFTGNVDSVSKEFLNNSLLITEKDLSNFLAGIIVRTHCSASNITVLRSSTASRFEQHDASLLRQLLPHLKRSLGIYVRVQQLQAEQESIQQALQRIPLGVLMTNMQGKILFMNRIAETILAKGQALYVAQSRLRTTSAKEESALYDHLRAATERGLGGRMAVSRLDGGSPVIVVVCSTGATMNTLGCEKSPSVIFLTDPEERIETSEEALCRLYRLSAAQAELASMLAQGLTLEQAARDVDISLHTARTQLKRIFRKTQTSRQSELVRLLLMSA